MSIGFGLIGTGESAEYHAKAMRLAKESKPVALAAKSIADGRAFAIRHGIDRIHDDQWFLLSDRDVDVVVVATPTKDHLAHALPFVEKGTSVIVESPLASTLEEATLLLDKAEDEGIFLGETNTYIFIPALRSLRKALRQGLLGSEVTLDFSFSAPFPASWRRSEGQNGGILMNQGYCALETFLWLCGEAFSSAPKVEVSHDGSAVVDMGAARFKASSSVASKTLVVEALGDWGRVRIENDRAVLWEVPEMAPPMDGKGYLGPYTYLSQFYDAYISSILTGSEPEPDRSLIERTMALASKVLL